MPDIAYLAIEADASSASVAVTQLDKLTTAAASTETAVKEMGAGTREAAQATNTAMTIWHRAGGTLVEVRERARQAGAGFISMADAAKRSGREVYDWDRIVRTTGDGAQKATGDMRNFMLQMNQVGQVAMITGNPLQALAVQLPDLLVGMRPLPMAIAMVGAMSASAALQMWQASDSADSYEDSLDSLRDALDAYTTYADIANASTISLREEFGANAEQVKEYARFMMGLKANDILGGIRDMENGFSQGLGAAVEAIRSRDAAVAAAAQIAMSNPGDTSMAIGAREAGAMGVAAARDAANQAAAAIHLTTEEVEALDGALQGMQGAQSLEALQAETDKAQKLIMQLYADLPAGTDTSGISDLFELIHNLNTELIRSLPETGRAAADAGAAVQEGFIGPMQANLPDIIDQLGQAYSEGNTERVRNLTLALIQQGEAAADAPRRLSDMREQLELIVELAEQDMGNAELQAASAAAQVMLERIEEAEGAVDSLNQADLTGLEQGFQGVVGYATTLLQNLGLIKGSLDDMQYTPGAVAQMSGTPSGDYQKDLVTAVRAMAERRGINPQDLLTLMAFETNYTMDPNQPGPITEHGQHRGLIQMGEPQMRNSGYNPTSGNAWEHVSAVEKYLDASGGLRPGDDLTQLYSMVLSGGRNNFNASDLNNGGVIANLYNAVNGPQFSRARGMGAELMELYGTGPVQDPNAFFVGSMGAAINRGEADQPDQTRPQVRPFELGVPDIPDPTRPQSRPFELAEAHTEAMQEEREAADQLIASFDPLIARELKLADAKRQLDASVASGAITPERAATILKAVEAGLDQEAAEDLQAIEDGLNGLLAQMDEGADIAQKYAEAQRLVAEALEAGVIKTTEEAEAILAQFHGHLLATSDTVQNAIEESTEIIEERKEAFKGAFDDIGQAMANVLVYGESWKEQFGNLLMEAAAQLVSSGFSSLLQTGFNSAFPQLGLGAGSSSVLPGIMPALGGLFGGGGGGGSSYGVVIPPAIQTLLGSHSYAGGGHTGYGPRSGGLDGQGGFAAMLHPQERVEDEYAGGRRGGGVMQVNVVGARGNREIEEMVQQGISSAFANYNQRQPDRVQYINQNWRDR